MTETVHITSLVVQCRPERLAGVSEGIAALACAEVAVSDPCGKLVVLLETDDETGITDVTSRIAALPGVLSANLVYHGIDETEAGPAPGQGERR